LDPGVGVGVELLEQVLWLEKASSRSGDRLLTVVGAVVPGNCVLAVVVVVAASETGESNY